MPSVRERARSTALVAIKAIHTAVFLIVGSSILIVFVDGVRGRPTRRTGFAAALSLAECAVYAANGFVCPLTPLAVDLGAAKGSVSDIFLPGWVARNLPVISSAVLVSGLALNLRALARATFVSPIVIER